MNTVNNSASFSNSNYSSCDRYEKSSGTKQIVFVEQNNVYQQ